MVTIPKRFTTDRWVFDISFTRDDANGPVVGWFVSLGHRTGRWAAGIEVLELILGPYKASGLPNESTLAALGVWLDQNGFDGDVDAVCQAVTAHILHNGVRPQFISID